MTTRGKERPAHGAPETTWPTTVDIESTRPFRLTSCARDCPDCGGTGAIGLYGLYPCDRRTQWLHRVGYGDLFGDRTAA